MIKQLQAAIRIHFDPRAGLIPLSLLTLGWALAASTHPDRYLLWSVCYAACAAFCMGVGLRLCLFTHRSHLVPGFRAAHGIVTLGVILPPVAIACLASRVELSLLSLAAGLVFCSFAALYVFGLSQGLVRPIILYVALIAAARLVKAYRPHGFYELDSGDIAILLFADTILGILIWRRIRDVRGSRRESQEETWRRSPAPSTLHVHELLEVVPLTRKPPSLAAYVFNRSFFWMLLGTSLVVLSARFAFGPAVFATQAFALPLMPVVFLAVPFKGLQRMFLLPMSRTEIVRRWGGAIFLKVLKCWAAVALPVCLVSLIVPSVSAPISLPWMLVVTLSAQLPLFGVAMALLSLKTRIADLRYSIVLIFLPFAAGVVGDYVRTHQTIPASVLLGSVLIWLAYRRWRTVEVG